MIEYVKAQVIDFINKSYFKRHFDWFIRKLNLVEQSEKMDANKKDKLHPIRPRKGDIYLIEFGQNIGKELSNTHMGIIVQNSLKNSVSSTVVVIPISSSPKLYDTHEKILDKDIKNGKLDKLTSKAKAEQIMCIDKVRLVHKVAEVEEDFMVRLEKRVLKNLDIADIKSKDNS